MTRLLQEIHDSSRVIQAIEDNTAEFLLAMGRAGGGEEKHDASISWTIGGSPIDYHNAVVRANLRPDTADAAIQDVLTRLQAHNVPGTWHLGPSMQPDDLAARLLASGFTPAGSEPGMAAFLPDLPQHAPVTDGLMIERVREEDMLKLWADTLAVDFGEGQKEARWVAEVYRKIGLDDAVPWRHYLGWLDGQPVATSSMYLGAGVAGIYFVFTLPNARRRGIGTAITLAPLYEAKAMGYRVAVLGSSESGMPVYERIGFRQYCDLVMYAWSPEKNGS